MLTARASFGTDSQEWWPFPTSNDLTFKNLKELPFIFKKERNQYVFFQLGYPAFYRFNLTIKNIDIWHAKLMK